MCGFTALGRFEQCCNCGGSFVREQEKEVPRREQEKEVPRVRKCSYCGVMNDYAELSCSDCGYTFARPSEQPIIEATIDIGHY